MMDRFHRLREDWLELATCFFCSNGDGGMVPWRRLARVVQPLAAAER
jgi:hypothetical protein